MIPSKSSSGIQASNSLWSGLSAQQLPRTTSVPRVVYRIGFYSAIFTTLWIIVFNVTALVVQSQILAVASSLLLAPSFLVLMASIHQSAPPDMKVWSQIGLSFAIVYMTTVGLNYFLQLSVVRLNPQMYAWLTMDLRPDSAFWALEILVYAFMTLAALFMAPIFAGGKIQSVIRRLFVVNGALSILPAGAYLLAPNPLSVLVLIDHGVWSIGFPIATALIAVEFRLARGKS